MTSSEPLSGHCLCGEVAIVLAQPSREVRQTGAEVIAEAKAAGFTFD